MPTCHGHEVENLQVELRVHARVMHLSSRFRAENNNLLLRPRVFARRSATKAANCDALEGRFDLVPIPGADFFLPVVYVS